jgi:branched-chain amino acid transport system ATP-binding protein
MGLLRRSEKILKSLRLTWEEAGMLKIENLRVSYGDMQALKGLSLEVQDKQLMAVLGSNGAGKSTLLNSVSGIVRPSGGEILFQERRINHLPPYEIAQLGIAHIPEGRRMFPSLTVLENLEVGSYVPEAKKERKKLLEQVFAIFPRLVERKSQRAGTLSGGEQQMVAIARGLMQKPRFIMLDEPSLGLAPIMVEQVYSYISQIHQEGITMLLVEQNFYASLEVAQLGCVIENGQIILTGSKDELLSNEFVKEAYLGI